jgi:VIT1/CCC1 family predicted Fe2+/Mn2+ transporter
MSSPPKSRKNSRKTSGKANSSPLVSDRKTPTVSSKNRKDRQSSGGDTIPKAVSDRMVKRVAFFSGMPTALGMLTFIVSYVIVKQEWLKLPNTAVVLVSMGCFGLGVLGLSYGFLSASWDEENAGSLLGWQEFGVNFGRLRSAWRSKKET